MAQSGMVATGDGGGFTPVDVKLTAYQLTLRGMRLPVWAHYLFNGLAAVVIGMLGHPELAILAFVLAGAFDTLQQHLLKRWIATDAGGRAGSVRLALLCTARVLCYTAPTFWIATGGGLAELAVFALQTATLLVVAMGACSLSRAAFWGLAAPLLVQSAVLAIVLFDPIESGAVIISLATMTILMVVVAESMMRTTAVWHAAFLANTVLADDLAAARDQAVADRTEADAAREVTRRANLAKSNFLATMSHEIRTPMNGVLGMAQLLQRDETNPVQAERLAVLIDSGEYLLSILNDILDISKIDAGKLDLVTAPEDLRAILRHLVGFWRPRADAKGITLGLHIGDSVPQWLMVDGLRLRQVLFNLVGNALKFTETGAVDILADAVVDDDTVTLRLSVRDTGPGIAEAHVGSLFERFSQVEDTQARRFGGTGLGLAIVKQLVELMDGRVWVESVAGQGSTFHIEAPLRVASGGGDVSEPVEPSQVTGPLRVLVVDDNAVNLLVVEQMLASFGHTIVKAQGGPEALTALSGEPFDLLITDVQMPGMGGAELVQRLRASTGPNRDLPAIALTADVTSGGRQHYLDQGFTDHSPKPIQLADLLAAMGRALEAGATPEPSATRTVGRR